MTEEMSHKEENQFEDRDESKYNQEIQDWLDRNKESPEIGKIIRLNAEIDNLEQTEIKDLLNSKLNNIILKNNDEEKKGRFVIEKVVKNKSDDIDIKGRFKVTNGSDEKAVSQIINYDDTLKSVISLLEIQIKQSDTLFEIIKNSSSNGDKLFYDEFIKMSDLSYEKISKLKINKKH